MLRSHSNEKKTFSETLTAAAQETQAALDQRRKEMDQDWDILDEGWQALREEMIKLGIKKPLDLNESTLKLNVGGSHLTVCRSVLERDGACAGWKLGNLFEAEWDTRVPRDSDGRIVLDESPTCVKHLIHALLNCPASAKGAREPAVVLNADEQPYLSFVSRALGLPGSLAPLGMSITGGTTILRPCESRFLTDVMKRWCPGRPGGLELLYRASRDGWTSSAFRARCGVDTPSTISLFKVKNGVNDDTIIGGYSSVPWTHPPGHGYGNHYNGYGNHDNCYQNSPGAFVFMLKDGNPQQWSSFQPMKWGVKDGESSYAVCVGGQRCPVFGRGKDLSVSWNGTSSTIEITPHSYNITMGSPFVSLNGRSLAEIEVFRLCPEQSVTSSAQPTLHSMDSRRAPMATVENDDDVQTFGSLIAGSLMEEQMVLHEARVELSRAKARTIECATALAEVYGPDIAGGKEDDVVELSVRGTRITTLRSTLRICAESALAAWFDEDKWPAAKKDLDNNGRRVIDCKPSVFSKVLDVLRMRKRAAWARGKSGEGKSDIRLVVVKAADRVDFEKFVEKHFPGDL